mmetsp:Transcript_17376/g.35700  ORF Transcript_17376/g.35700 Transcript_17376/m.35700 type:complete len:161 (-) Transcript_17376:236-718(-)
MSRYFNIYAIAFMIMISLSGLMSGSEAFTTPIDSHTRGSKMPITGSSSLSRSPFGSVEAVSPTQLLARKKDLSSQERGSDKVNSLIGIDRGLYLWAIVIAINIWFFSIPVEFRRTRICSEADTRDFPTRCMTSQQFTSGIAEYYRNGGGIKFDFSIEGKE